jgi:hypothetical protein
LQAVGRLIKAGELYAAAVQLSIEEPHTLFQCCVANAASSSADASAAVGYTTVRPSSKTTACAAAGSVQAVSCSATAATNSSG